MKRTAFNVFRELSGYGLDEISNLTGIDKEKLEAFEEGTSMPDKKESDLLGNVLNVSGDMLLSDPYGVFGSFVVEISEEEIRQNLADREKYMKEDKEDPEEVQRMLEMYRSEKFREEMREMLKNPEKKQLPMV